MVIVSLTVFLEVGICRVLVAAHRSFRLHCATTPAANCGLLPL